MPTGRPKKPLGLTDEERVKLEQWARRPKTARRLALRSRAVLRCAQGLPNQAVARELRITGATVGEWRERFRTTRLEGLVDETRPGPLHEITDAQVEDLITVRWSRRHPRPPNGVRARWPGQRRCRAPRSPASGKPSACSRIAPASFAGVSQIPGGSGPATGCGTGSAHRDGQLRDA